MPHVKELYEQYDENIDWDAIRKGAKNPNDLDNKFGIHGLPTKILIDPTGKIIGRYAKGTDEEAAKLDAQLAAAFLH